MVQYLCKRSANQEENDKQTKRNTTYVQVPSMIRNLHLGGTQSNIRQQGPGKDETEYCWAPFVVIHPLSVSLAKVECAVDEDRRRVCYS